MPDRDALRSTFDAAASTYQTARPDYPPALFDAIVDLTGVEPGDRVLEVGPGPGKATLPLAARGFRITAVELGAALAAEATANLAPWPDVGVEHADFETWNPPAGTTFDLVVAATAWHWLDPAVALPKARSLLRPGGHLAVWAATHVFPVGGDPFFEDIQAVYDEIGEPLPPGQRRLGPDELPDDVAAIEASGCFDVVAVRRFDWEVVYDADGYVALLDTFSGHLAMADWQRDRLYGEVRRRLALRPDGRLRRHWGTVLHVARRR